MTVGASVVAALGAAMSFALAAILQQEAAQSMPVDKTLTLRLLTELLRRPKWVAGVGLLVAGYGLQLVALAYGPVALVQPIVITELAFAIPLAIWRRHRPAGRREWTGIGCVLVGIATFLLVASPQSGNPDPGRFAWLLALLPAGAAIVLASGLGAKASGPKRAMLLGAAAGMAFGVLAVLTKATTHLLGESVGRAFTSWQLYGVVALGILALVLSQSAYQAGPLAYSLPLVGVLEPVVAVFMGATVLGEQVQMHGPALLLELLAALVACGGIELLATSPTVLSIYEEGGHPDGGLVSPGQPCTRPAPDPMGCRCRARQSSVGSRGAGIKLLGRDGHDSSITGCTSLW